MKQCNNKYCTMCRGVSKKCNTPKETITTINSWRCGKCDGANVPEHSRHCMRNSTRVQDGVQDLEKRKKALDEEAKGLYRRQLELNWEIYRAGQKK